MHADNPTSSKIIPLPTSFTLLISVCFFLSGLAGLIYEVVWARQLGLFLGITSYAHTAVITAYMAGLAAGSLYFGRRADLHAQPLKIYAWLEIGVGLYAALTPWLFTALQHAYISFSDVSQIGAMSGHLTRFTIALLALLLPTFLMGGTLPLLVRGFVSELPGLGRVTGRFYGINTLGATVGTLFAGYLLLPRLGVTATIFTGVGINLAVAVAVLAMLRRFRGTGSELQYVQEDTERTRSKPGESLSPPARYVLLIGFGTAGFASLLTQMAWIRALILVVGGSVYAFTITLASFLVGIGLGSLVYSRLLTHPVRWFVRSWLKPRMAQAALLALLISFTLLLGLSVIGKLPGWFLAGYAAGFGESFPIFQLFIFILCASVIVPSTLFMGILFPLVAVIWTSSADRAGRGVGAAYAINTTGTILGALLGGLFILPWLGVHYSIHLAAGLYFLVATAFWMCAKNGISSSYRLTTIGATAALLVATAWIIPAWDKSLMVSGVFRRAPGIQSIRELTDWTELLYYKEGLDGVVAVRRKGRNNTLVINGKPDASSKLDLPTQILLGQLPLAVDRQIHDVLVIGLGSGITAGTLATSDRLKSLTILEISKEVVEASAFFVPENRNVLADPRVNLVTADARNFLMASPGKYDLIVSEPSNPWISGISNLFTDEFFKLAKSRLNTGGVMTQWFHTYRMSNLNLRTILKTFDDNFQYVSVWQMMSGDLALIGSDHPYALSMLPAHAIDPNARKRAEEFHRAQINHTHDLAKSYIFGGSELTRYVGNSSINSDNNPIIEFSAPRIIFTPTREQNTQSIFESLGGRKQTVPLGEMVHQSSDNLDAQFMNLKISNNEGIVASLVEPKWEVTRQLVEDNGERVWGTASERILTWQEGSARFHLKAVGRSTAPSRNSLLSLLEETTRTTGRQGGSIKLPDNIDAIWLVSSNEEGAMVELDIAWDCKAQSQGSTRYALHASLPNPGQGAWRDELDKLAGRFRCY